MENGSKKHPDPSYAETLLAPFSRPFSNIDFLMHFGRPLAHFWHPFGSLWLSLGSLRLPLGALMAPIGSLWAPVGSLLLVLGLHFLTFDASRLHLGSSSYNFIENVIRNQFFLQFFIKSQFVGQPIRKNPKSAERTPTESQFSLAPHLPGPGAEHLPQAT